MNDEELDRDLSALLDGELSPDRERQLREEIEASPRLRERLAQFENVDEHLRALPQTPMPAELGARLRERIGSGADSQPRELERPTTSNVRSIVRSNARWGVPLAAALAAGLVAVWMLGRVSDSDESDQPEQLQAQHPPMDERPQPSIQPSIQEQGEQLQAENQVNPLRPKAVDGPAAEVEAGDSSDEELAIGLDLETLRDLDLIQELDLLEALLAMETTREGPG
jgi:hypothetical protein